MYTMKRIFSLIFMAALLAAGCQKNLEQFVVTPTTLEFGGDAESQTISVTAADTWAAKITEGSHWLSSSKTFGKASSTVTISVTANSDTPRSGKIVFSCSGQSVEVTVNQAPGTAEEVVLPGEFYPDPTSGITVEPAYPNADKSCTIVFKPESGNPLYGHTGELYGHFGVVVDGEWQFVPTDWGTTEEKTHFTKVADNHWEFKMERSPTIPPRAAPSTCCPPPRLLWLPCTAMRS